MLMLVIYIANDCMFNPTVRLHIHRIPFLFLIDCTSEAAKSQSFCVISLQCFFLYHLFCTRSFVSLLMTNMA